jgi:flagellar motor switch protein FliN
MSKISSQEEVNRKPTGEAGASEPAPAPPTKVLDTEAREKANLSADPSTDIQFSSNSLTEKLKNILEISLSLRVEIGQTKVLVEDLLKLHKGSVIELSKRAGDPLGIFVNGMPIASGEVVVVNERFGLRVTNILDQAERIRSLGK